jgi:hypothetical protein
LPLAHAGDKKVKRFHFSEIIGRLPYVRATVTAHGKLSGTVSADTSDLLVYYLLGTVAHIVTPGTTFADTESWDVSGSTIR